MIGSTRQYWQRSPLPRLLALAALAAACQQAPAPVDGKAASGPGKAATASTEAGADTLIIAVQSDFQNFVSLVSQSENDGALIDEIFEPTLGSSFDCRLQFLPAIVESWEHPADSLSLTYHLKKGLTWSDGHPLTAKDFQFTYDLVADPKAASPRVSYLEHMVIKDGHAAQMIDDHTIKFEFNQAYDRMTQMSQTAGVNLVPEHILGKEDRASLRSSEFNKTPVVSGPWKIAKWEKGQSLTLVPNENYKGPRPAKLARVIFKVIPEYATRLVELENGSVDMIDNLQNMEDIDRLKKTHPELTIHRRGWRFMDYVVWNFKSPLFADKSVRQALTMAIDRPKIIQDLLSAGGESYGVESVSWITPALCDYKNEALKPFPVDPEKARAMLAAAGWKDSNGDGILDKDGKPFRFTLITNSGNARRAKAVIIIQANLKAVGVDCQLQQVEGNAFFERLRKKDFDAALSGWSAGLFVDPAENWHSDTAERKYQFNFCSYANPKADELMDKGMKIADTKEAAPVWQELQAVIYDDQPYTFLYWRDEMVPLHSRFRDAHIDILSRLHDLSLWWVPKDKVKHKL